MGFDTLSFWIVFLIVVGLYQLHSGKRWRNSLLLLASYFIYGSWSFYFLPLLIVSTLTDYFTGFWVEPGREKWKRKTALGFSLFVNLGMLVVFKYLPETSFFHEKRKTHFPLWASLGVPIGISFYTFQTLSYTFDIYRGKIKHSRNFLDVALYVSFFPQLAAGPIEKARRLLPQIQKEKRRVSFQEIKEGLHLILLGLFKKVYISNSIAVAVDFAFQQDKPPSAVVVLAALLMTFQVYTDFSGYSDMARGMARFFGIDIMINFKPFFYATSPQAFWRSWHISFMEWARDYLILPFRDPKKREWHLAVQFLVTMMVVGLWHKLTINWFLFGLMHGIALVLSRNWSRLIRKYPIEPPRMFRAVFGLCFMYLLYFCSGLLHRSADFEQARHLVNLVFQFEGWHRGVWDFLAYALFFLGPLLIFESIQLIKKDEFFLLRLPVFVQAALAALVVASLVFLERVTGYGFVYFEF